MPASVVMNYNDSVYSIDSGSDKESHTDKNILTWMVCSHSIEPSGV